MTDPADPVPPSRDEVWEVLGNMPVRLWTCLVPEHRFVEWIDEVAHCRDCDLTSEHTRRWIATLSGVVLRRVAREIEALYPEAEWPAPSPVEILALDDALREVLGASVGLDNFTATTTRAIAKRLREQAREISGE